MKQFVISLALLLLGGSAFAAQIDTLQIHSKSMNREIATLVATPDHSGDKHFPVLYLLHGYSGSHLAWQQIMGGDLGREADRYQMIIVCPNGDNSWYWDSPVDSTSRFETFVSQELTQWVDANYPTEPRRESRAITGLSMGGHGAMWLATRHKDIFGAAGSTSGGVDIRPFPKSWEMEKMLGKMKKFPERWDAHTVMTSVETLKDGELAIIFDCGYEDFFFEVNNRLHEKLLNKGISHDYIVRPGKHNAAYWSNSLPYQLLFFSRYFESHR